MLHLYEQGFQAINNAQLQYNWLITDCVCYPQNNDIEKLLNQEYCWLTGDELSAIIEQEDFQWIWGCLCGFTKDITMEEVLKYPFRLRKIIMDTIKIRCLSSIRFPLLKLFLLIVRGLSLLVKTKIS